MLSPITHQPEPAAWFFKLPGPVEADVHAQAEAFHSFLKSVHFADGRPQYDPPAEWQAQGPSAMRFETFQIPGEKPLELAITTLPRGDQDEATCILSNINRWRGQMSLQPLGEIHSRRIGRRNAAQRNSTARQGDGHAGQPGRKTEGRRHEPLHRLPPSQAAAHSRKTTARPKAAALWETAMASNTVADGNPAIADRPEPARRQKRGFMHRVLHSLASLRLTVTLFALAIVLIFAGTLAQVDKDIWEVMNLYFRAWVAWIPFQVFSSRAQLSFPAKAMQSVPGGFFFPGGFLIGSAMAINLLAAHGVRFTVQARGARLAAGLATVLLGVRARHLEAVYVLGRIG